MSHWVFGGGRTSKPKRGGINPGGGAPPVSTLFDNDKEDEPTVLIVGAGTFGTSAAWHFAQNYQDASKVTIIDRADSPPTAAAAIDINRVVRTDYASPMYSNLAYEAWHAWFWSLELQKYFHQTGWLMMDDSESSGLSKAIRNHYKARGWDPTEDIPLDQLDERWGGIMKGTSTTDFNNAYFNPEVGWCDAAGATKNFMDSAIKKGVKRVIGDINEILLDNSQSCVMGVRAADGQEYMADKVLIAAGAWTSALFSALEDRLQVPEKDRTENQLRTIGVLQVYYQVSDDEIQRFENEKFPVLIYGQQGEVIPPSKENRLLKFTHNRSFTNTITTDSGAKITTPVGSTYEAQVSDIPDVLKQEAEDFVLSRLLPNFTKGKKADHWRVCYDARSPTEDYLICKYPHGQLSNLFIASGGSSHSYKFLPNAGKYIMNIMNGKSNGEEKDNAWSWKEYGWDKRDQSPEYPKLGAWTPKRELRDVTGGQERSRL